MGPLATLARVTRLGESTVTGGAGAGRVGTPPERMTGGGGGGGKKSEPDCHCAELGWGKPKVLGGGERTGAEAAATDGGGETTGGDARGGEGAE